MSSGGRSAFPLNIRRRAAARPYWRSRQLEASAVSKPPALSLAMCSSQTWHVTRATQARSSGSKNFTNDCQTQTGKTNKLMSAIMQQDSTITPELDQLCINTIRALTLDAVQKAK